jgi:hypothetical protein
MIRASKEDNDTDTLRTALAFSSSSFFFCFNWFSFLTAKMSMIVHHTSEEVEHTIVHRSGSTIA